MPYNMPYNTEVCEKLGTLLEWVDTGDMIGAGILFV